MELNGVDVSVCAAALHTIKDPSVEGRYSGTMVYFLVPCVILICDWICKPRAAQHRRGQSVELRQCCTNQDSGLLRCNTKDCNSKERIRLNQCGLSEKRGYKTSVQGFTICLKTHLSTKTSQGLGYNISSKAACHSGYDFRSKHCASDGGANLNAAEMRTERTGLNLHFILVILFSTNKLTPEKT